MPNYSLIANTQFKARNFDDLIRPYAMYTQEYRAQEDALSELATKADVWQGLANEQTDPMAYAQYTNYANSLKEQAAVLASSGLNPSSRQELLNLKRRYASEITPIEQAYANRKAQADEQRKALLQNPTLLLSRRADATSLDRYLENQNLGYDSYSGALLTQQVGQAAQALAKELRDYGKGKPLDGFTKTWLQQTGLTASEVAFAINNPDDPRASKVLNTIVNNVMGDSGISQWADNSTLNQAYKYARQGLWNAVGETKIGTYEDKAAIMAAELAKAKELERYKKSLEKPAPEDPGAPRGFSLLEANGGFASYNKLNSKLSAGDGKLKADYFGKKFVNPVKAYEEAWEKFPLRTVTKTTGSGWSSPSFASAYDGNAGARAKWLKDTYGITTLLSSEDYKTLKELGYNKNSSYSDFINMSSKINKKAKEYQYHSVNLSNLDVSSDWVSAELAFRDSNGNLSSSLWEFKANGTKGKAIDNLDDIDLTKNKLTDVYYSRQNPGKIVIQLGSNRYLADPSLISSQAKELINYSNQILSMSDNQIKQMTAEDPSYSGLDVGDIRDAIAESTTAQLRNLMRSYNKTRSNTDSNL